MRIYKNKVLLNTVDIFRKKYEKNIVTIQGIVNGALLSAAIIPSKTGNRFFLIVEM